MELATEAKQLSTPGSAARKSGVVCLGLACLCFALVVLSPCNPDFDLRLSPTTVLRWACVFSFGLGCALFLMGSCCNSLDVSWRDLRVLGALAALVVVVSGMLFYQYFIKPRTWPGILKTLNDTGDRHTRLRAARTLPWYAEDGERRQEVILALANAIEDDSDENVREAAAAALVEIDPSAAASVFLEILATHPDHHYRYSAVGWLSWPEGRYAPETRERVADGLQRAIREDPSEDVRFVASVSLNKLVPVRREPGPGGEGEGDER